MKKLLLLTVLVLIAACTFAVTVGAQVCRDGEHQGEWEVRYGNDVLTEAHSMEICKSCGFVLSEEDLAPIIEDKGFSYFNGSVVQGYYVDKQNIEKYISRTGKSIEYGIVAASREAVGTKPLGENGEAVSSNVITVDIGSMGSEHFDIKVISIPEGKADLKIILCAYIIIDGKVIYVDNGAADTAVAGVSYNEIVEFFESGKEPLGLHEYRALTVEEMDILTGHYWFSNNSVYSVRLNSGNNFQRYAAPRMFSRDELPAGSYIVIEEGWNARPEIWKVKEDGTVAKNSSRPYEAVGAGVYTITELFKDTVNADGSITESDYKYISFNISDTTSSDLRPMTAEGITDAFKIYVPCGTKVAKTEVEQAEKVSVAGMQLLQWDETSLFSNAYWNCTSSTSLSKGTTGTGSDYYATKMFTKEELPVGSVIEISGDFVCRFEYWINSAKVSTRGALYDGYRIVITEDFWDSESERAFNISHISKEGSLSEADRELIEDSVRIYIPVVK